MKVRLKFAIQISVCLFIKTATYEELPNKTIQVVKKERKKEKMKNKENE